MLERICILLFFHAISICVHSSFQIFTEFLSACSIGNQKRYTNFSPASVDLSFAWGPVKFCFIFYEFILLGTCKLLKLDLPDDLNKNIMKCLPLSFVMLFAFKYALSDMIRLQLSFCSVWMVHLLLSSFLETNNFCMSLIIRLFFFSCLTVSSFNQVI